MTNAILGSLVIAWLSTSPPLNGGDRENSTPSALASRIIASWPDDTRPSIESVKDLLNRCGRPSLLVIPPRPGDPLQGPLVSRLSNELVPLSFTVEDGERLQSAQERDADRTFAETSDASAATRVLLARQGDYELKWRIEVAIEGPKDLYGVETWQATAHLHATLIDLLLARELPSLDAEAQVRQRTREDAIDQSIASVTDDLARAASQPLLRNWYAAGIGSNVVLVEVTGQTDDLAPLQGRLEDLPGVASVTRATPSEPPRLLVEGSLTAGDVVDQLGEGKVVACRQIAVGVGGPSMWLIYVLAGICLLALIVMLVFRRTVQGPETPEPEASSGPEG